MHELTEKQLKRRENRLRAKEEKLRREEEARQQALIIKQKTDEKKLCSFMGKLMFILAGCWLVIASSEIFKAMWLLWVGLCLFFVVCIGAVIYMNSGNRFKR